MQTQWQTSGYQTAPLAEARNKVLRNTYWLLGLSMLPTVMGALVGVKMGFSFFAGSPVISFLLFMGIAFGFMWGIERTKHSSTGVALLLGFTFFMGLMLSRILQFALHLSNGAELIAMAGAGTATIFVSLATVATVTKRDFSFMGKFLFVGMILLLVTALANAFFQLPILSLVIAAVAVLLFSAYILFDISQVVNGGETNYITATLSIYLDVYNVFVSLLQLLMAFGGERD